MSYYDCSPQREVKHRRRRPQEMCRERMAIYTSEGRSPTRRLRTLFPQAMPVPTSSSVRQASPSIAAGARYLVCSNDGVITLSARIHEIFDRHHHSA
jgi:hypothetical protein